MTESEKRELLDDLGAELVKDDLLDLSFALEDFDDYRSDLRWQKISACLREERNLPERFALFCEETPSWEAARAALS